LNFPHNKFPLPLFIKFEHYIRSKEAIQPFPWTVSLQRSTKPQTKFIGNVMGTLNTPTIRNRKDDAPKSMVLIDQHSCPNFPQKPYVETADFNTKPWFNAN
jgi:hypothetical protein